MHHVRIHAALLTGWLFALYNVERLIEPINLASFVYGYAAVLAVLTLLLPVLQRLSLAGMMAIIVPLVLLTKRMLGYPITGAAHLPLTVTELCVLGLTLGLARGLGQKLEELRQAVGDVLAGGSLAYDGPFGSEQGRMYREVRRARQLNRPLALLSVEPSHESLEAARSRILQAMQREHVERYAMARLGEVLTERMSWGIVARHGTRLVVMLSETQRERAEDAVRQAVDTVRKRWGIDLRAGIAMFPDEEVTLVQLVERAERHMESNPIEIVEPDNGEPIERFSARPAAAAS